MNGLLFFIGFAVLLASIAFGALFYPISVLTGLIGAVMMSNTVWDHFKS